jgi:hypothetical protein
LTLSEPKSRNEETDAFAHGISGHVEFWTPAQEGECEFDQPEANSRTTDLSSSGLQWQQTQALVVSHRHFFSEKEVKRTFPVEPDT